MLIAYKMSIINKTFIQPDDISSVFVLSNTSKNIYFKQLCFILDSTWSIQKKNCSENSKQLPDACGIDHVEWHMKYMFHSHKIHVIKKSLMWFVRLHVMEWYVLYIPIAMFWSFLLFWLDTLRAFSSSIGYTTEQCKSVSPLNWKKKTVPVIQHCR